MKKDKFGKFFKLIWSYAKDLYTLYEEKKIGMSASALTYYVVLSLVPVLSIIFGIAKGFGLEKTILKLLENMFKDYPKLIDQIYVFVQNMLGRTSGGIITGFGILMLCYSAYNLLNNIEISVNHVWKANYKRHIKDKLPQYFMLLILTPILMAVSTSLQTLMNGFQKTLLSFVNNSEVFYKLLVWSFNLTSVIVITFLIALFYTLLPQVKRIKFKYTFWVSLGISILYIVVESLYITMQTKLSSYNAVYGSFAAVPIALVWLQLSWTIILMGNALNYLIHKRMDHIAVQEMVVLSAKDQKVFTLYVLKKIISYFEEYNRPITQKMLYEASDIPVVAANRVIEFLKHKEYIYVVEKKEGSYFLLGKPAQAMTIAQLFDDVETWDMLTTLPAYTLPKIEKSLYDKVNQEVGSFLKHTKVVE